MYRVVKATTEVDPSLNGYVLLYHDDGKFVYRDDYAFPTLEKANEDAQRSLKWKQRDIDVFRVENGKLEFQSTFEYNPETDINPVDVYEQKVDDYLNHSPGYVVNSLFGDVEREDSRFQNVLHELWKKGYKPRTTYYQSRMHVSDAITIDVPEDTTEVPEDVIDAVESQPNLMLWDATTHLTKAHQRKLKFGMRDTKVRQIDQETKGTLR